MEKSCEVGTVKVDTVHKYETKTEDTYNMTLSLMLYCT